MKHFKFLVITILPVMWLIYFLFESIYKPYGSKILIILFPSIFFIIQSNINFISALQYVLMSPPYGVLYGFFEVIRQDNPLYCAPVSNTISTSSWMLEKYPQKSNCLLASGRVTWWNLFSQSVMCSIKASYSSGSSIVPMDIL